MWQTLASALSTVASPDLLDVADSGVRAFYVGKRLSILICWMRQTDEASVLST